MTAKEFLSQAYRIDLQINSKLEQLRSLRELSTKATSSAGQVLLGVLYDPKGGSGYDGGTG
jgi:hypothetical protein